MFFVFTMYFSGGMVPSFMLVNALGLVDTIWAMLIPGAMSTYNMIIARTYMINSIPDELYEAAEIDGAGKLQRIFKITIPMVRPTMIILVLLAVGGIFRGNFDLFYNLIGTNGTLYDVTDVIDTFTFRALINNNDIGMAAASGFFQSVLCFVTVVFANRLVSSYDKDYALF